MTRGQNVLGGKMSRGGNGLGAKRLEQIQDCGQLSTKYCALECFSKIFYPHCLVLAFTHEDLPIRPVRA